ncbi:MAG: hypothetical protein HY079_09280 [Elusimicrobia bacterium]|nr:hypothetical protein [Elusimicrobiota bacterium]
MKSAWMLPVLLTATLPLAAVAQKDADPETKTPPASTQPSESRAQTLADEYKVPLADVQGLRDKGLGWGEIGNALAIAQKSGKPLSDVMKLRDSGMGWGQIAQKYGFKLGDAVGRGGRRDKDGDHDRDDVRGKGRDRDHERGHGREDFGRGRGHGAEHGRGRGR